MIDSYRITRRLIFAGGPPRSGTTLLAKLLNAHGEIVTVIDNSVYENWALYNYRLRTGLVQQIRDGIVRSDEPQRAAHLIVSHIVQGSYLRGAAPGPGMEKYKAVPLAPQAIAQSGDSAVTRLKRLIKRKFSRAPQMPARYLLPSNAFGNLRYFCLKSPEIVFVLSALADLFPGAKFVLVYRSVEAIAESMYRKGNEWRLPSYHRRWALERSPNGTPLPPPGVPREWHPLWEKAGAFQRCVIYASSYLRAMAEAVPALPAQSVFLYHHARLCQSPASVLDALFAFLGLSPARFARAFAPAIHDAQRGFPPALQDEYQEIALQVEADKWPRLLHNLESGEEN